jgi:polyferredoxin
MKTKFQHFRLSAQVFFALLCIVIGVEFARWVRAMESQDAIIPTRPPSVEAFLPISSLMNAWHWLRSGEIQMYHPAGVFIFLGIVVGSFALGKFFCSWMCPVGFMSEILWKARSKLITTRAAPIPRWLDFILRSFKYILLSFFVFAIFFMLDAQGLRDFLESPYNLAADAKMYDFFANISVFAFTVIVALVLTSLFVRNAWCRFLCPYGALLGVVGLLSPNKIKRDPVSCINCEKCSRVCPAGIDVHLVDVVKSDECSSCLECVSTCPAKGALGLKLIGRKKALPWKWIPVVALSIYSAFILWGVMSKRWNNKVDPVLYKSVIQQRSTLGHPGETGRFAK